MTNSDKIALFDLDGTLADFTAGLREAMLPLQHPIEVQNYDNYDQETEATFMRARRRLVKSKPGFWRNLSPYQPGFDLLKIAVEIGFRITVFTKAPRKQPAAFAEKAEWCHQHLNPILGEDGYDIAMVTDKGGTYGRLLVDDWPPYIEQWLQHRPRGKVVMPAHGYNEKYRRPSTVYRYKHQYGSNEMFDPYKVNDRLVVETFMKEAFER